MKINFDSPAEDARIEIVPLIDVIFCILTFFILAALQLTRQQAISVDLPKASTAQPQVRRELLLVQLDAFGQVYVQSQRVNLEQLSQELLDYRYKNPAGLMVLYAAKETKYNDVVQILDKMREIGGERVALATLPGSENQPSNAQPNAPINPPTPNLTPLPPGVAPGTVLPPGMQPLPGVTQPSGVPAPPADLNSGAGENR
ncbi:biopolymer transporter ExbD [Ancylothrix sp. C2]|uniref:ExbD/TolR family protein n=1 Tax=Ancylothrix sp. D3o TaxID=2953691 RepID=UPI0021BBACA6|nr:biopolymer transporter ExbD [Ancylothrix sp. D3o]MCT7948851.1 biopolymer transporter ExbD [Ancylothrix sp. D3o]